MAAPGGRGLPGRSKLRVLGEDEQLDKAGKGNHLAADDLPATDNDSRPRAATVRSADAPMWWGCSPTMLRCCGWPAAC
jgi:hypothetical protein